MFVLKISGIKILLHLQVDPQVNKVVDPNPCYKLALGTFDEFFGFLEKLWKADLHMFNGFR